jgi:hypothetical protein
MAKAVMVKAVTIASNSTVSPKTNNSTVILKANSSTASNQALQDKEATNRVVTVYHSLTIQSLTRTDTSTPLLDLTSKVLPRPTTKAALKVNSTGAIALMASVV